MKTFRKKVYAAAGYNTTFFGPGRKEFDPKKPMPSFETYLEEAANGAASQLRNVAVDEGIIGSFMSQRFLKQANLPAFLPMVLPPLKGKPCTAVEGACGTGGRAIAMAVRAILSDMADVVFVLAFEMQNVVKAVYGADILAGAGYYRKERKKGLAHFFPGIFDERAGAYFAKYGKDTTRQAFAAWYEQAIHKARQNPKAQEYHNQTENLYRLSLNTPPNPERFLPHLNQYDCSKVSDGASAIFLFSEEGLKKCGVDEGEAIRILSLGESEGDIAEKPNEPTLFENNRNAAQEALEGAGISLSDLGLLEIHDCFTISALLTIESIGLAQPGKGGDFIIEGHMEKSGTIPTNLSGGLCGFGHPTGASGVRQLVDLSLQLTGRAANQAPITKPHAMMLSMGGNDKTVTAIVTGIPPGDS